MRGGGKAYGVADGEFLFGADDGAAAGGGVEGAFAADDGFALGAGAFGFAADFGDGVPVVHGGDGGSERCCVGVWWFSGILWMGWMLCFEEEQEV